MRFYRNNLGLSQSKLADKVDTASNYIAAIEAERKFPSVEMLERIAGALKIDAPELFSMKTLEISSINKLHEEIVGDINRIIADYMTKRLEKIDSKGNVRSPQRQGGAVREEAQGL
jgi:transcriptional regulator with XRE-family HTH domain